MNVPIEERLQNEIQVNLDNRMKENKTMELKAKCVSEITLYVVFCYVLSHNDALVLDLGGLTMSSPKPFNTHTSAASATININKDS